MGEQNPLTVSKTKDKFLFRKVMTRIFRDIVLNIEHFHMTF